MVCATAVLCLRSCGSWTQQPSQGWVATWIRDPRGPYPPVGARPDQALGLSPDQWLQLPSPLPCSAPVPLSWPALCPPSASLAALHCPSPFSPAGCQHPKPHSPAGSVASDPGLLSPDLQPLRSPERALPMPSARSTALSTPPHFGTSYPPVPSPDRRLENWGPWAHELQPIRSLSDAPAPSAPDTVPPMVPSPPGLAVRLAPPSSPGLPFPRPFFP